MECKGCGAPLRMTQHSCEYCRRGNDEYRPQVANVYNSFPTMTGSNTPMFTCMSLSAGPYYPHTMLAPSREVPEYPMDVRR